MLEGSNSIKVKDYNLNIDSDNMNWIKNYTNQKSEIFKNKKYNNHINYINCKENNLNNKLLSENINIIKTKSNEIQNNKTIINDFDKDIIEILSELNIDHKNFKKWECLFNFSENNISESNLLDFIDYYIEDIILGRKFRVDDVTLEKFNFNIICFLKINSNIDNTNIFNQTNINALYNKKNCFMSNDNYFTLENIQKYMNLYNHKVKLKQIKENLYYGCNLSNNKDVASNYNLKGKVFYLLGNIYYHGLFKFKQDYKTAYKFYRYGALNYNDTSIYSVANCLEHGIGTSINLKEAVDFYRLSYKIGYPKGIYRYSCFLLVGNDFVNKNIPIGYHLLRLAAKKTNKRFTAPIYDLAMIYLVPNNNVIIDKDYAIQILLYGAKLGCKNCKIKLSELKVNNF